MNQPLDLSITLTESPQGSPPDAIASIALHCDGLGLSHTGDLLRDPLTQKERDDLRWYLEEYWQWPYEGFAQRGRRVEGLLVDVGKRLYEAVFGSRQADRIAQRWLSQSKRQLQISIISDIPKPLSLPWELLHSEQGFLVLRTRNPVSMLRRLPQSELSEDSTSFELPLHILLVTARPNDAGFVDPRSIARELLDAVREHVEQGTITVEFLRPPTLPALRTRLSDTKRSPIHVLHFDGHGTFDEQTNDKDGLLLSSGRQGLLLFENTEGTSDFVEADDVAQVLQDSGVRLAVLTACQSAMGSADDAFSSVAARLIRGGVDAVAAMSTSVLVASAARYVEAFYRELAKGTPAATAQERARQALHDDPRRHIHRRHRDEEGKPVELRDWWLPHFYQQRPLVLQPTKPTYKRKKQQLSPSTPRVNTEMPAEPRYGFSGRARELLSIERSLLHGKLGVIHGFGGVGKTALVREAADWLTRTAMYDGACFVSFEYGGDAMALLSALGIYLGVYDGHYNPDELTATLARLKSALKKRHTLVIIDNLESILPGGEAPLDEARRTQLWGVMLELAKMSAGVLVTSRDTAFGDGRLTPGKQVTYLELGGLHPEDAYALATRVLTDLSIDRKRVPYMELRNLLKQLDYYPLAIQLVLPTLRELPLSKIAADFAILLPMFMDDMEAGRNRSLLASLNYSLRRLGTELQTLLPRLAVFEGGTMESELLAITEIPQAEWDRLRPALEQAALLTIEQVHEGSSVRYLRFHPLLVPFLRTQPGADDAMLRDRYAYRYLAIAELLYTQDALNPWLISALVQQELPNLRRALALLREAGDLDNASLMTNYISRFLTRLGRWREVGVLRQLLMDASRPDTVKGTDEDEELTLVEFLRERGLGEDELGKGNVREATAHFSTLLERIEALPEGTLLGRGSSAHCSVLQQLAGCFKVSGQLTRAKDQLNKALEVINGLLREHPENEFFIGQRTALLGDLGDILFQEGRYPMAQEAYEEVLQVATQQGVLRDQALALGQLGMLAQEQGDYDEARSRYEAALRFFHDLSEPATEAIYWHKLGTVARDQEDWIEAERCYRKSLALSEHQRDAASTARICNELAIVAMQTGRSTEAEGWYKQAIASVERTHPGGSEHALYLNNLATLLVSEMRVSNAPMMRLAEARSYAERALAIRETLDASENIWATLWILAEIATLEGRAETAQVYRRRERESFATFEGNRFHTDQQFGPLITAIATAATGNAQARKIVADVLPELEANGWHIAAATQRIWMGERDWYSLVEDLDSRDALLVLRVLETLAEVTEAQIRKSLPSPARIRKSLPSAVREALDHGDIDAFKQIFDALSLEKQRVVVKALHMLKEIANTLRTPQVLRVQEETMPSIVELAIASLPPSYQGAARDDITASELELEFEPLSPEEQQNVMEAMRSLQTRDEETEGESDSPDIADVVQEFEPLLQAIAAVAVGDATKRSEIEAELADLEEEGWYLMYAVQQIWAGERNVAVLTEDLDEQETVLVQRILGIIIERPPSIGVE